MRVRSYYNETADLYLEALGPFCQAGLIEGFDPDPYRSTMMHIKDRANIRKGSRILDAGSGLCGPCIHLCQMIPDLSVEAITVSEEQASRARRLVEDSGFTNGIHVTVGDYHQMPFPDESFDVVLFLESTGYSYDPPRLFREVRRVLRHSGTVYIKDVFCFDGALGMDEMAELATVDETFVQITRSMNFYVGELKSAGFNEVRQEPLPAASTDAWAAAMWHMENGSLALTAFGKRHYRPFRNLPLVFGEIVAKK